jgi:hypothetical protein
VIQRSCQDDCPNPAARITPAQAALRILVEFPDGHPRKLTATRLYVDGKLAAERTADPFTSFDWDLSGLTASGTHHIAVEAVDSLGLTRRSIELPVQVEVTFIRIPWWQKLLGRPGFLRNAAVGAGLLGVALAAVLTRRRLPRWAGQLLARAPIGKKGVGAAPARAGLDPAHAARRAGSHPEGKPAGCLVRLGEDERPIDAAPVQIAGRELSLGSDPTRADVILEDPSVDRLHARLVSPEAGGVRIVDAGTVAGTWVNDEPVPPEGRWLEDGDVVSLGAVTFRFAAGVQPHPRQVVVEKVPQDHDLF